MSVWPFSRWITSVAPVAASLMVQSVVLPATWVTVEPAEWNLVFLLSSLLGPLLNTPLLVACFAVAAALGWLAESAAWALARRRPRRRTRIERIEREAVNGER